MQRRSGPPRHRPTATYRLQLHGGFRLADVVPLVPYLAALGISDVYLSPLATARGDSVHGYDVVDPTAINPEIGTVQELEQLAEVLHAHQMSALLDIVPNHLCISDPANRWWQDVLAHGRASRYQEWFAIDWDTPFEELRDHVALPILQEPLPRAIENGALTLAQIDGRPVIRYGETLLPATDVQPGDDLRSALDRQAYRLSSWKDAPPLLNYRRFFDVNDLVGVRQEVDAVFDATHALPLDLLGRGIVQGLRVDHIDGLHDPRAYLARLRGAAESAYLVVEKILGRDEELPTDWPVDGTTGYDAMAMTEGVLTSSQGVEALRTTYAQFTGSTAAYEEVAYAARELLLRTSLASDLANALQSLRPLLTCEERTAVPEHALATALGATIASLPVYRTYLASGQGLSPADGAAIQHAAGAAHARNPLLGPAPFALAAQVLRGEAPEHASAPRRCCRRALALRLQQLTGAVMAKGVEDTAFYRWTPLASLAEVGNSPGLAPVSLSEFHRINRIRAVQQSGSMVASTTHDTKRSEDVRARIRGVADVPAHWIAAVARWHRFNHAVLPTHGDGSDVPEREAEYLLYQTLLGIWPEGDRIDNTLAERLQQYMLKALREAKWRTSWIAPDEEYEGRWRGAIEAILQPERSAFLADFAEFARDLMDAGRWSALSALVLKCTIPGVPDFYQGSEVWTDSLVDPDNRRPVDFARLAAVFESARRETPRSPSCDEYKLWLTHRLLHCRHENRELFGIGDYRELRVTGPESSRVVAFARRHEGVEVVVAVARHFARLLPGTAPCGEGLWAGTHLVLPEAAPARYASVIDGRTCSTIAAADGAVLPLAALFATTPFAVLARCND